MEENAAAVHTAINSVQALGRGFDVNFDTRLLYCKGVGGSRVVEIDNKNTKDLWLYDNLVVPNVSRDIKNSQDTVRRESSGVCSFLEVCYWFCVFLFLFCLFSAVSCVWNLWIVDLWSKLWREIKMVLCRMSRLFAPGLIPTKTPNTMTTQTSGGPKVCNIWL